MRWGSGFVLCGLFGWVAPYSGVVVLVGGWCWRGVGVGGRKVFVKGKPKKNQLAGMVVGPEWPLGRGSLGVVRVCRGVGGWGLVVLGRVDVVVVGGGPVGLLLAAELGGFGVRVVVLEAGVGGSGRPRATTVHARAVQSLVRRGYVPGAWSPVGGGVGGAFHFGGVAGLVIGVPAGEPVPVLKCAQAQLEREFEVRALGVGVRVVRGCRVVGLRQFGGGVRVVAEGPGGCRVFKAGFVVGADGARSAVRELAGVRCETRAASVSALTGVVRVEGRGVLVPGWHRTSRGWVVVKGVENGKVLVRTVDGSGPVADRGRPVGLEELRGEVSRILGREVGMVQPRWLGRFSDFSRLACTYRAGRVLLAGDAAHVHFPVGGQGLSTGLLDAVNLGWKLALAVRETAGEGLLDSYDAERRPAAARVVESVRAQVELMRMPSARAAREALSAGGAGGAERLALMVSGQDTVVPARSARPSSWEGRFLRNVALRTEDGPADLVGLLREGRMLLLRFGPGLGGGAGVPGPGRGRWVRTVRAEPVAGIGVGALLVRPDGYVAWADDGGDALEDVLDLWCVPGGGVGVQGWG
ncbi:FAD-dependent monooxygenase [Streptomyces cyaneofuscatus]|uniref:FAD-dependent monooxygenase n=1 Tax=Streptomyces cyaneofuscatus TaxID=66883 RepID=UPI003648391D